MSHDQREQQRQQSSPQPRYPLTYHTPRAEAIYEQCPWDQEHVEALYPVLKGRLVSDGLWHDIPNESGMPWVGRYRVTGSSSRGYFQAVYADDVHQPGGAAPNMVFSQLSAMEPVQTEDDAEWSVWHLQEADEDSSASSDSSGDSIWYALSSTFATTPGQFAHQQAVDDWLGRHGLGLEPDERFVEGVAYFEAIEPGCLLDAMQRLRWLETVFAELNQHLERAGAAFWEPLKEQSDALLRQEQDKGAWAAGEIVPVPEQAGWNTGRKRRAPTARS